MKSICKVIDGYMVHDGVNQFFTETLNEEQAEFLKTNELIDLTSQQNDNKKVAEYFNYLKDTDFYYARKLETGEDVPAEVVTKRLEARGFLRLKGY